MLAVSKILCPTDFSEPSFVALDLAIELADHFRAALELVHVVDKPPMPMPDFELGYVDMEQLEKDALREARNKLKEIVDQRIPSHLHTFLAVNTGDYADSIVSVAEKHGADVIVIATHGLTGWRHLVFGSVAERVVRTASCATLVVRQPETHQNHAAAAGSELIHSG